MDDELTKRELFAILILQGMVSHPKLWELEYSIEDACKEVCEIADCLIDVLKMPKEDIVARRS